MQEQLVKQLKQVMSKKRLTDTIKQYMEQSEVERLKSKAKDVSVWQKVLNLGFSRTGTTHFSFRVVRCCPSKERAEAHFCK